MTTSERTELLKRWIKPSSANEQDQQARAESMVRKAINASPAFDASSVAIYTKGSYPNNTNVRRDSDVDVVVELQDCFFYDYWPGVNGAEPQISPYSGDWTPASWRRAVKSALVLAFGAASVDASGAIAINVGAVAGSRPSADVVPSFKYRRYDDAQRTIEHEGSCVFPSTGGAKIVNWPTQQLRNGRALNNNSGGRYKDYTRALKNAENVLAQTGTIDEMPSYFMECLAYNTPVSALKAGTLDDGFRSTLVAIWAALSAESDTTTMLEPNELKYLFIGDKKWTVQDGKDLIQATWTYLGYES